KGAVSPLRKLLSSPDRTVAMVSAEALGRIGDSRALQSLERAAARSEGAVHRAEIDSITICANRLLEAGKGKDALKIFDRLYQTEKSDPIRVAAFRGVLLASGSRGIARMRDAIVSGDGPAQSAALIVAAQWPQDPTLTRSLADLLPTSSVPVQLALIQCLMQRGDPGAMSSVAKLVESTDTGVSVAAISALGRLGDDSVVSLLAEQAASDSKAKRDAARESLIDLNRGPVTEQMLAALKTSPSTEKADLMRALAERRDRAALPVLMDIAQNGNEAERAAAFQALGELADASEIPRLVQCVTEARSDDIRSGAADALNSVLMRVQSPGAALDLSSFVTTVKTGRTDARLALLPVCSDVAQDSVREALRAAAADSDSNIREAGIHALCDTKDAELLPDLIKFAQDTNQPGPQLLAIRGCVRLTTQEDTIHLPNSQKLSTFKAILETPLSQQEKQLVLSGLGTVADLQALDIAEKMLDDSSVHAEAERAVIQIATAIAKPHPKKARAALKKISEETSDEDTRKSAEAELKKIKSK
ncbi:MAG TPA: HEAT repeat domain-containing protein, partial [Verrucomicrobiae bacterium]|nr:HEAT repeat domain-containing protein [Verrucomicrobiae bacterium]